MEGNANIEKMNKVSVIVPVYNYERFLPKCIDSILGQTYGNIELILIDDGSTDGSSHICDAYAKKDPRVMVKHKPNGGIGSAYREAFSMMTGDYVAFVDADDYIEINAYEELLKIAIDKDADIVEFGTYAVDTDHKVYGEIILEDKVIEGNENVIHDYFFVRTLPHLSSKFIKRKLFDGFTVMNRTVAIDELMTVQLLINCNRIAFTHKAFYYAVRMKESVSRAVNTGERLLENFESHKEMISYLQDREVWFTDYYVVRFLKLLIGFRYNLRSGDYAGMDGRKIARKIDGNYRLCYQKVNWRQSSRQYTIKDRIGLRLFYVFPGLLTFVYAIIRKKG